MKVSNLIQTNCPHPIIHAKMWYVFLYKNEKEFEVIKYRLEQLGYFFEGTEYDVLSINTLYKRVHITRADIVNELRNNRGYPQHQLGSLKQLLFTEELACVGTEITWR